MELSIERSPNNLFTFLDDLNPNIPKINNPPDEMITRISRIISIGIIGAIFFLLAGNVSCMLSKNKKCAPSKRQGGCVFFVEVALKIITDMVSKN